MLPESSKHVVQCHLGFATICIVSFNYKRPSILKSLSGLLKKHVSEHSCILLSFPRNTERTSELELQFCSNLHCMLWLENVMTLFRKNVLQTQTNVWWIRCYENLVLSRIVCMSWHTHKATGDGESSSRGNTHQPRKLWVPAFFDYDSSATAAVMDYYARKECETALLRILCMYDAM